MRLFRWIALVFLAIGFGSPPVCGRSIDAGAPVPEAEIDQAIARATKYLIEACGPDGKFVYLVDPAVSAPPSADYDIVRHAGAIYALAMSNRLHPDPRLVEAMARASQFMRRNFIRPDPMRTPPRWDAVWNAPPGAHGGTVALLGATGLGLVALSELEAVRPGSTPPDEMQALGRFLLFMQNEDGSFAHFSYFAKGHGKFGPGQSLYFPGEAALALVHLHELTLENHWLSAGERTLDYLAKSRRDATKVPADNWALVASAKLLALPAVAKNARLRQPLVAHAVQVCHSILEEQVPEEPASILSGGFESSGRITPTSTRLEGLQAALNFLPPEQQALRLRIELAVNRATRFLLRSQIRSGPYAGGIPRSVGGGSRATEIRIDYVQHFLSAMIRYKKRLYVKALASGGG